MRLFFFSFIFFLLSFSVIGCFDDEVNFNELNLDFDINNSTYIKDFKEYIQNKTERLVKDAIIEQLKEKKNTVK